jgi:hypothetical protein
MIRSNQVVMAVIGGCLFALPIRAQNPTATLAASPEAIEATSQNPLCLRGRTLSSCRAFLITEVAFHLDDEPHHSGDNPYLSWTMGATVNVTDRDAVGAAFSHTGLDNGQRSRGRDAWLIRYRRWILPDGLGLDFSVGLVSTAADDPASRRYIANLGVSLADITGVFGQTSGSPEGPYLSGGFKVGALPGLILSVASLIVASVPPIGN